MTDGAILKTPVPGARWIARLGEILTRDYCSRYDRYLRWARNPLAVLILAMIASGLCGLFLHPQGFVLAFGLAVVLTVGVVWPSLSLRGLGGTLSFEKARTREGDPVRVRLSIRNRNPWGAWGLAVRAGFPEGADRGVTPGLDAGLSHAAGWRTTEASWDFVPECRGEYPTNPPRIASGFPFGLWTASRPLRSGPSLVVWPRTFPVGPIPQAAGGRSSEGMAFRDKAGNTGDVLGVRAYRRGDPLRRVHWPQTARQGELIVCELQANSVPWVQVVLDTHTSSHAGSGPQSSREWAIRIAASFLEEWIGQGAEVEAIFSGRVVTSRERSIKARRSRVLDALARIGSEDPHSLADLLDIPACREFGGGLRIIVTTDVGLRRFARRQRQLVRERFVVLRAASFAEGLQCDKVEPLPVRPWILVDDPARIPQHIRQAWKEVLSG
jgi:uncharacterized protein (DUF58 family)